MPTSYQIAQLFVDATLMASALCAIFRKFAAWPLLIAGQVTLIFYFRDTGQGLFLIWNVGMVLVGILGWWMWTRPPGWIPPWQRRRRPVPRRRGRV